MPKTTSIDIGGPELDRVKEQLGALADAIDTIHVGQTLPDLVRIEEKLDLLAQATAAILALVDRYGLVTQTTEDADTVRKTFRDARASLIERWGKERAA